MKKETSITNEEGCVSGNSFDEATQEATQEVDPEEIIIFPTGPFSYVDLIPSFHHIRLDGFGTIIFTAIQQQPQLKLSLPDEMADMVEVYMEKDTLVMGMKPFVSTTPDSCSEVKLYVSAPMVDSVTLNGTGDISFPSLVISEKPLSLILNGSGDIDFRCGHVSSLNVAIHGSGEISLNDVTTDQIEAEVFGSGKLSMDRIEAGHIDVTLKHSGFIDCMNISAQQIHLSHQGCKDLLMHCIDSQSVCASLTGQGSIALSGRTVEAEYSSSSFQELDAEELVAEKVTARSINAAEIGCYASKSITLYESSDIDSISYKGDPEQVERIQI